MPADGGVDGFDPEISFEIAENRRAAAEQLWGDGGDIAAMEADHVADELLVEMLAPDGVDVDELHERTVSKLADGGAEAARDLVEEVEAEADDEADGETTRENAVREALGFGPDYGALTPGQGDVEQTPNERHRGEGYIEWLTQTTNATAMSRENGEDSDDHTHLIPGRNK